MLLNFKKTRMAGAMALAFTMAATSLSAGGAVQMPAFGQINSAANYSVGLAELMQVNHRVGRKNGRWCRNHPRRCRALNNRGDDRPRFKRGHRGSKWRRHGHRRHSDGWWYPLAAFALGAYIVEQNNHNQGYNSGGGWNHIPRRNIAKHDNWCDWKYRSYSHRTKTFQPYHGPRKFCNSPYDLL